MMYYSNDYLCHYGVLGMKWGQHLMGKRQKRANISRGKKARSSAEKKNDRKLIAKTAAAGALGGVGWAGLINRDIVAANQVNTFAGPLLASTIAGVPSSAILTGTVALGAIAGSIISAKIANTAINNRYTNSKPSDDTLYIKIR